MAYLRVESIHRNQMSLIFKVNNIKHPFISTV